MNITVSKSKSVLTVILDGRLDTFSSPMLETKLEEALSDDIKKLVFDCEKREYISSAGLRVLAVALSAMEDRGKMLMKNVSDDIREVFEVTSFIDFLTII